MLFCANRYICYICTLSVFIASCNNSSEIKSQKPDPAFVKPHPSSLTTDSSIGYENILKSDSLNTEIRLKLAAIYYESQNYPKAIENYMLVSTIDKNNKTALFNLGNIYYDTGQNEQAIVFYTRFLESDKANCNVRCDLATCYMRLNNNVKAISLLRENIKINGNHPQSHYNLSVILNKSGKTDEANEEMKIFNQLVSGQKGIQN